MAGKNSGGWFRSKPWVEEKSKNGETNCFILAWGEVITPKNSTEAVKVISFQNRYGSTGYKVEVVIAMIGKNFERLISWGDNKASNTMSKLQNGDRVAVLGKERTYHYKTKNGEEKEGREMDVFMIWTDAHMEAIEDVISNPGIISFMERAAAADAALPEDATESSVYDTVYNSESAYDPQEDKTESNNEEFADYVTDGKEPEEEQESWEDPDEYFANPDLPEDETPWR